MKRKTQWILTGIFFALGILSMTLPVFAVKISGRTFTKTQTAFFLSASLLSFVCVCLTQILAQYTREKKINLFFVCAIVTLAIFGVSVWL